MKDPFWTTCSDARGIPRPISTCLQPFSLSVLSTRVSLSLSLSLFACFSLFSTVCKGCQRTWYLFAWSGLDLRRLWHSSSHPLLVLPPPPPLPPFAPPPLPYALLSCPLLSTPLLPPPPPSPPPSVTSPSLIACNVPRKAQSAMTTCVSTTSFPPAVVQHQPLWNERRLVARRPHRPRQSSRLNCQAWITTLVCCLLVLVRSTNAHQLTGLTRMHARNEPADLASTTLRPSGSATATGSVQVASDISTALPRPFDSNIGNNFTTASCPAFFDRFLGHGSFIQCLPLSLLLQVS